MITKERRTIHEQFGTDHAALAGEIERLRAEAERFRDGLVSAASDLRTLGNCIHWLSKKWSNFAVEAVARARAALEGK